VVREYVGHGIGRRCTRIPTCRTTGSQDGTRKLGGGMVFAIEPMVNAGGAAVRVAADGWTVVTKDGSLSAHFEHTVAVTSDGPLILTRRVAAEEVV
jgi:methionyl aminopeptidase